MLRMVSVRALLVSAAILSPAFAQTTPDASNVEPAQGKYQLLQDSSAYRGPSVESGELRSVHSGKRIVVTGATKDFAQVSLRDGAIGYVPLSAIALLRPADNSFILSSDTPLYAGPHLANSTVATLHRGSYVHVIGVALYYLEIRMDSGVVGFIPVAAVLEHPPPGAK
jgi:hypothetical protein